MSVLLMCKMFTEYSLRPCGARKCATWRRLRYHGWRLEPVPLLIDCRAGDELSPIDCLCFRGTCITEAPVTLRALGVWQQRSTSLVLVVFQSYLSVDLKCKLGCLLPTETLHIVVPQRPQLFT